MTEQFVGKKHEIDEGDRKAVLVNGREIFVYNIEGEYYAYANWCPHQGGPACEGDVTGTEQATFDKENLDVKLEWCNEGEILVCPWHGWEFNLTENECLSRRDLQLAEVEVKCNGGDVLLDI